MAGDPQAPRQVSRLDVPLRRAAHARGGFALGFSTDDAGRAEGWHGEPDAPLFLVVDEAKTVPDQIFEAFERCTRKLQLWVSSPGAPRGQFYDSHHKDRSLYWTRRVPSTECPHIPDERRDLDRIKYGEDHPLFRSKHLAEFTADDELMVLSPAKLTASLDRQPKADESGEVVAFCDFAAGRDENVLAIRRATRPGSSRRGRSATPCRPPASSSGCSRRRD